MSTIMSTATAPYHLGLTEGATVEMTAEQIRAAYASGTIALATRIWRDGMEDWLTVADLAPELRLPPPPKARERSPVSAGGYAGLAFLFGPLGIHNMYAGHVGTGVVQLATTLGLGFFNANLIEGSQFVWMLSSSLFWAPAIWLWALCEIGMVRTDGRGRRFRQ